ncbi:flavin oxidoreductase [Gammaproteobacteria bacterium LSUCC0057]|uniref:Flavin oxidoreductase n=1 Tax=Gammaproteobacteria bacterium LSUCC0057 TaxID=2559237 RepID=A0A4Y8UJ41_9GAMM|nr:flavin oxidoreductase [Gammaproteobacteria bacterium LSUCC0057]
MHFDRNALENFDSRYRAALINSVSGYKPANLVGTANASGQSNLAVMSSVVHLGSHPPLLALVVRPGGDERHTLANLLASGEYTINHINRAIYRQAHQTAARYPAEQSEFAACGLTEQWLDGFSAPFVAEATVQIGMQLRQHMPLEINATHLVIGEIVALTLPDAALRSDGSLDLASADTVALSGLDEYLQASRLARLSYAKPDQPLREIEE